jgi:hypothetical protein
MAEDAFTLQQSNPVEKIGMALAILASTVGGYKLGDALTGGSHQEKIGKEARDSGHHR